MEFWKMNGAGNDFIILDNRALGASPARLGRIAQALCRRRFSIGADGLMAVEEGTQGGDFKMRFFNSDGSLGEMCGNGIRCVGKFLYDKGLTDQTELTIETLAGEKTLELHVEGGTVVSVSVDMGEPILTPERIPVLGAGESFLSRRIMVNGREWAVTCVSMGNPHAVVFVPDVDRLNLEEWGPAFEHHAIFPNRTNTEFVEVENQSTLRMRVWERGSGETMACGTGACAALVAAVLSYRARRIATVKLRGGSLTVRWEESDGHVYMTGPAVTVFEGEWPDT